MKQTELKDVKSKKFEYMFFFFRWGLNWNLNEKKVAGLLGRHAQQVEWNLHCLLQGSERTKNERGSSFYKSALGASTRLTVSYCYGVALFFSFHLGDTQNTKNIRRIYTTTTTRSIYRREWGHSGTPPSRGIAIDPHRWKWNKNKEEDTTQPKEKNKENIFLKGNKLLKFWREFDPEKIYNI